MTVLLFVVEADYQIGLHHPELSSTIEPIVAEHKAMED
jgi:hypothetical protein